MDQRVLKRVAEPDAQDALAIPDYLEKTYHWAYINPETVTWLDRGIIVWAILWGNSGRLMRAAFKEIKPGTKVLQAAYVYGGFTPGLARHVGSHGQLDVIDIVPLQVENCRKRLRKWPQADARLADAAMAGGGSYEGICCYFLLHEMPNDKKIDVVKGLLDQVAAGGKLVFVDYHRPARFHPLAAIMNFIWRRFEPYAFGLLETEIQTLAGIQRSGLYRWSKQTYFGGLYQKVVAERI